MLARQGIARRLHARPRLPVRRRRGGVPGRARDDLRGRAEPRRAAALAARRSRPPVDEGEAALDPALRRIPAARPSVVDRRCSRAALERGCQRRSRDRAVRRARHDIHHEAQVAKHPSLADQRARADPPRLRGRDVDAVRRLRPRLDHRRDRRAPSGSCRLPPAHDRQALRHRLLVEDTDLLRQRRARLQLGARPHALHRHRRQRGQPRAHLHRRLGRRRLALDRPRASSRTPSAATSTCCT